MPVDERRIEEAFAAAAPAVDTDRVLDRVATKRVRRRRVRRIEGGVVALVVVAVIGLTAVVTTRDDGPSPHVAAPAARLSARIVNGAAAVDGDAGQLTSPTPVDLDRDPGDLQPPLLVGTAGLSMASYDPASGPTPSHVVRVDGTHVVDIVDFKAQVISITEGEGARWALTRNLRPTGGTVPDSFLKRIAVDGTSNSFPLPVDADPVGPVAAIGGAVWVPTRAGLEQFDTNGNYLRSIPLDPADTRSVAAIGKTAWVTDGDGLRRLDAVTGATSSTHTYDTPAVRSAAGDVLNGWLLTGSRQVTFVGSDLRADGTVTLPAEFIGDSVTVADDRVWVTGAVGNDPAIVLLDGQRVLSTVILQNSHDATLVWSAPHAVTAVTNNGLVRIALP